MTPAELEAHYAHAFGVVRQHCDPSVWWLVDSLQRSMELSMSAIEGQRIQAQMRDGMLETRLAVVERKDD